MPTDEWTTEETRVLLGGMRIYASEHKLSVDAINVHHSGLW